MDIKICLFTANKDYLKSLMPHDDLILKSIKKFGSFTVINFFNILNKKNIEVDTSEIEKKYNSKIIFFYPKSKKEFNNFVKYKKIFAIDTIGKNTLKVFSLRKLINKKNIFMILLLNYGFVSNEEYGEIKLEFKNYFYIFKDFMIKKIYRLLVLIKVFPPVFLYFECKDHIFKHYYSNQKFHFIEKYFPFLNIFNIKKIIKINSKAYDTFTQRKYPISENKIIFIDGNYKNEEFFFRENPDIDKIEKKYFKLLGKFLKKLENIYNQKVEICLHPSSNIDVYKNYFEKINISISKGLTEKKIYEASIVVFHESSAIMDAILCRKKIISLDTNLFGMYHSNRVNFYKNTLKLFGFNLDEELNLSKDNLNKSLDLACKNYEYYIKNNLNSDKEELGSEKILRVISNYI